MGELSFTITWAELIIGTFVGLVLGALLVFPLFVLYGWRHDRQLRKWERTGDPKDWPS